MAYAFLIPAVGTGIGVLVSQHDTVSQPSALWGMIVRTGDALYVTWLANSAACLGYQPYDLAERSLDNFVVALLTNWEGWHNNHHAAPLAFSHGHSWWELDLTLTVVRLLQLVGLARKVGPVESEKPDLLTR